MEEVVAAFFVEFNGFRVKRIVAGKIHQSYRLTLSFKNRQTADYLLQKINRTVFTDIALLQKNLQKIISYYRQQSEKSFLLAAPVATIGGDLFFQDKSGNFWRVFTFFNGYSPLKEIISPDQALIAGKTFADFIFFFRDFSQNLPSVIPGFRNFKLYLEQFELAKKNSLLTSRKNIKEIITKADHLLQKTYEDYCRLAPDLPRRLLHNDPKINNLLVARDSRSPVVIVDLDTVNFGYLWQEFGDLLRSALIGSAETETRKNFDLSILKALIKGFLEKLSGLLLPQEAASLAGGPAIIACELALRFLADYLENGSYFDFKYKKDKLSAADNQLSACQFFLNRRDLIVREIGSVLDH